MKGTDAVIGTRGVMGVLRMAVAEQLSFDRSSADAGWIEGANVQEMPADARLAR
jgi:hypothetical protein